MSTSQLLTLPGQLLYPLAGAGLCLWLGWNLHRLYQLWSAGELATGSFYALASRAGLVVMTVLSLLIYLASGRVQRLLAAGTMAMWPLVATTQNLPRVTLPNNAGADGDIFATFTAFASQGGRVLVLLLCFTGICGLCWQLIAAFAQARDGGDWGKFGAVFVVGATVLLILVALGQFAWSYLDSLAQI